MRSRLQAALLIGLVCTFLALPTGAQNTTTGELSGVITDPSGAVVANVTVLAKNVDSGSSFSSKTNAAGLYKFSFLQPGVYLITAGSAGFQMTDRKVEVALGSSVAANLQLSLSTSQTTIEVTGEGSTVETEDANVNTNFDSRQVALLPNPGNDLSAVALTAPGVVMNTSGGAAYGGGNYEFFGLPATSNLFTYDGANDNDPYFNVNNTGATNLSLGLNDVQETAVVANGYSGSYGGLAGANINFISKSGTNSFHGNAEYWWNGRVLDANNYFRNQTTPVTPRPFVNANQWASSFGGPVIRNKAFFFFDYEGLRLVIPSPTSVNLPTTAFENAVIANLNTTGFSASVPFYQHAFALWNGVPQAGAQQLGGGTDSNGNLISAPGCSNVTPALGAAFSAFGPGGTPCAVKIQGGLSAHTHDVLYVGRFDENIGTNDKIFVRVEHEHGLQASYTDPISSAFNAVSDQPQWQSQFSETHTFSSDKVNNFVASLLWYSSGFAFANPAAEAGPTTGFPALLALGDNSLTGLNGEGAFFPQGRNITQYQIVDDYSWVHGLHNLKVGVNFRRDDISDQNFTIVTPYVVEFSLADLAAGGSGPVGSEIIQNFPSVKEVPIAMYQLGAYAADDVKLTPDLKLTLSLRVDHLSNPVCQTDCFQRLAAPFEELDRTVSVNQAILTGQHNAFPSVTGIVWEPKVGFAWSPAGSKTVVVRGGGGVFADALPTGAIDSFLQAAPLDPQFISFSGPLSPAQSPVNGANNLFAQEQMANAGFKADFASGNPATPPFSFYNATAVKVPRYYEWSLEVQKALGWQTTFSAMYVGNRGTHEEISNGALNAWCCYAGEIPVNPGTTTFGDLPTGAAPDQRFGQVSQQENVANSNYNGLIFSARHNFTGGFEFQASYTWSHALDEISNNSLSPFGVNTSAEYADVIFPEDPANLRRYNYGNSDYDVRHNFVMNYVWNDAIRHVTSRGPNVLMKGWVLSGTVFRHSGLPFTPYSNNDTNSLTTTNYGGGEQYIFADVVGTTTTDCSGQAAKVNNPCLSANNFGDPVSGYSDMRRNQFRGPGYFDTDFAVEKSFGLPKWEGAQLSIGARFFNVLNHPNFYFPIMNINSSQFGQIIQTVSTPTSIYGSGLGADSSPRLVQLQAKFVF